MKFKAAVLEKIGQPPNIKTIETTELKYGQVLVKNIVSGLCGAQVQEMRGHKGNKKFLPHLMGHEGCGIVQDVGEAVSTVKKGDKVVMHWRLGTGLESPFPEYVLDGKLITSGKITTLSEYSIVSENRLTVVPQDTDPYICALLGCGMTTAMGVINNDAQVKFGESVLILGAGGVGLNLIQAASLASAYPITVIEKNGSKKDLAVSLGATQFVSDDNALELLDNQKYDVIIDTTGSPRLIHDSLQILEDSGRFIMVGQPPPNSKLEISNPSKMWTPNGRIFKVSQGGDTNPAKDIPRYVKMHSAGMIDIEKIITNHFPLSQIGEAFNLITSGKAGRIMINMGE